MSTKQFSVKSRKKGDIQQMLKKWKNKSLEFGITQEIKDRMQFIKPSAIKRRVKQVAVRNQKLQDIYNKEQNG